MKRIKSLFIISLFVIFLFSTTKSIAQLLKSSNYFGDSPGYNSIYSSYPFLTDSFPYTHLNPYIRNHDLQTYLWSSSTSIPLFQYFSYYNYPFNFWYDEFYNHLNQSLVNINASENQKEQSIDQSSEEKEPTTKNPLFNEAAEIITKNDNGEIFTFHVGDEFLFSLQIETWESPFWSKYREHWLEKEEIKPENGYGFEKVGNTGGWSVWGGYWVHEELDYDYYRYRAIQPGENELIFNCYVLAFYTEGPDAWKWIKNDDIIDTFTITIRIID